MKKITQRITVLLVMMHLVSCSIKKDIETPPKKGFKHSKHIISVDTSEILYNNFKDRFREPIKGVQDSAGLIRNNYEPTKYVLINIDVLEDYIKLLREVEKKKGNEKITGVAVFFGANSLSDKVTNKPPFNKVHGREMACEERVREQLGDTAVYNDDIRGRITIFMAPTFRINEKTVQNISEVERHVPFYIRRNGNLKDPYIGDYMNLLTRLEPIENKHSQKTKGLRSMANKKVNLSKTTTTSDETSLILEELTDMPPRSPQKVEKNDN